MQGSRSWINKVLTDAMVSMLEEERGRNFTTQIFIFILILNSWFTEATSPQEGKDKVKDGVLTDAVVSLPTSAVVSLPTNAATEDPPLTEMDSLWAEIALTETGARLTGT